MTILLQAAAPLIESDAIILGILFVLLAFVQITSSSGSKFYKRFYQLFPPLLLIYFVPGILNSLNIVSGERSQLYTISSKYLLPAGLVLFTLSVDLKELWKMRKKAGAMFLAGAIGVIIGGPLTILIVSTFAPSLVGGTGADAVWRGLATVAGSWIGGSANLAALREVFLPSPALFSSMVVLDSIIANLWLAILLVGVSKQEKLNKFFKANNDEVDKMGDNMQDYQLSKVKVASLGDLLNILAAGFGCMALAYFLADPLVAFFKQYPAMERFSLTSPFFWVVIMCTTFGVLLSFTRARNLEGAGASRIGTIFLYMFMVTVGMQMDIVSVFQNSGLLIVGLIWLSIHVLVLVIVGRIIKAPYFFLAVASEANLGGAVQASFIASAFKPSLAPVGVLLAVFGYVLGNYGGYICGILMEMVAPLH